MNFRFAAVLLTLAPALGWPQVCVSNGSAYNDTACPASATCCPSLFSSSMWGCCPYENAVCCPNRVACCPQNTECVPWYDPHPNITGDYDQVYNCTPIGGGPVTMDKAVCKPGPPLEFSTTLKNVLIIGDSVSIMYTEPYLIDALADVALVQHAPWGGDGGAEETAYAAQCLGYFTSSPSGVALHPDLVMFNSGMHSGPVWNVTVPGQNEPAENYNAGLTTITNELVAWSKQQGARLLYALTSPMLCNTTGDGCVMSHNNFARPLMESLGIPILDTYSAITAHCGPTPQASCFNTTDCFCPHCPGAGSEWLAYNVLAPAIRTLLDQ